MGRPRTYLGARENLALASLIGLGFVGAAACGARSDVGPTLEPGSGGASALASSTANGTASSSDAVGSSTASGVTSSSMSSASTASTASSGAGGSLDVASSAASGGSCGIGYDETVTAKLRISADDQFALYAQGVFIEEPKADWTVVHAYPITLYRHPERRNTLAVRASNVFKVNGRDRGLVLALSVPSVGALDPQTLYSDAAWRASPSASPGWEKPDTLPNGWPSAVTQAGDGAPPWGTVIDDPKAQWLWTYDSNQPIEAKIEKETNYFRRDFYFTVDGKLTDKAVTCP